MKQLLISYGKKGHLTTAQIVLINSDKKDKKTSTTKHLVRETEHRYRDLEGSYYHL